jgi:hypothetical protein
MALWEWSIIRQIDSDLLGLDSRFQETSFWMLTSTFEESGRLNRKSVDFFNGSINNSRSIEFVELVLFLFDLSLLLFRFVFTLISLLLIGMSDS